MLRIMWNIIIVIGIPVGLTFWPSSEMLNGYCGCFQSNDRSSSKTEEKEIPVKCQSTPGKCNHRHVCVSMVYMIGYKFVIDMEM